MRRSYTIGLALFPMLLLTGPRKSPHHQQNLLSYYYWAALYNDSTLYDSNHDNAKTWKYTIHYSSAKPSDKISLIYRPDCCYDMNPSILVKDSSGKNTIRRYELTEKIAVKDIIKYAKDLGNKCWLLYTEQEAEKDGTIIWNNEKTYPRRHCYPGLLVTIVE